MKKAKIFLVFICIFLISGCSDREQVTTGAEQQSAEESQQQSAESEATTESSVTELKINTVNIPDFPIVDIECVKDGDYHLQTPEEEVITETSGTIVDYLVNNNCIYYIIAYDYYYHDYYEQIAVFCHDLENDNLTLITDKTYENGINIYNLSYDEGLTWTDIDSDGNTRKCIIEGDSIIETPMDNSDNNSSDWQSGISAEYLDEMNSLIGENDNYIVWIQWAEENDYYSDSYINILDKQNDNITQILKKDYGSVRTPVLSGNIISFLTTDDIKSYTSESDFYGNVYAIDLTTMEEMKITENYGSADTLDTINFMYDMPKASGDYIFFMSQVKEGADFEYQYMYYIKTD